MCRRCRPALVNIAQSVSVSAHGPASPRGRADVHARGTIAASLLQRTHQLPLRPLSAGQDGQPGRDYGPPIGRRRSALSATALSSVSRKRRTRQRRQSRAQCRQSSSRRGRSSPSSRTRRRPSPPQRRRVGSSRGTGGQPRRMMAAWHTCRAMSVASTTRSQLGVASRNAWRRAWDFPVRPRSHGGSRSSGQGTT